MKRIREIFIFSAIFLGIPEFARADCPETTPNGMECLEASEEIEITDHSTCKKITNNHPSGRPIMIPHQTSEEWSAFYTHSPSVSITIEDCGSESMCSGASGDCTCILTTGSTFSVPSDWNSSDNSIEVIGGGGGGGLTGGNTSGSGGGGGGYTKVVNLTLTPETSVNYSVGIGGGPDQAGGDTWLGGTSYADSSIGAKGGGGGAAGGAAGGAGGAAASAITSGPGAVTFSGGNGGVAGTGPHSFYGGSGGGAAGPGGNGGVGGAGGSGNPGGTGGGGLGGVGGARGHGIIPPEPGGDGTELDGTRGSGGGGGSGYDIQSGADGGVYGGGGGGSPRKGETGGSGGQGIIFIRYAGTTCGT